MGPFPAEPMRMWPIRQGSVSPIVTIQLTAFSAQLFGQAERVQLAFSTSGNSTPRCAE